MIEKDISMNLVKVPAAATATGAAIIGVDQVGKTKPFQHKMRSDADVALLESSGAHLIPTSTPARKFPDRPHYYVNEGSSFSPATRKINVGTVPGNVARIRAKFDPNAAANEAAGKSPGLITFERLPESLPHRSS